MQRHGKFQHPPDGTSGQRASDGKLSDAKHGTMILSEFAKENVPGTFIRNVSTWVGSNRLQRIAVIPWALSADLLETTVELRKRLKAHVERDLADPQVRIL